MAFFALSNVWWGANVTLDKSSYPEGAERDCQLYMGGAEMLFYHTVEQFNKKKSKCAYGPQHFFNNTCKKWIWSSDWDSCSRSLCFFLSNVISSSSLARCPSARVSRRVSWARIISFTSPCLLSSARSSSVKIRSFSSNTLWDECWNEKNTIDEIGTAHSQISFTIPVK